MNYLGADKLSTLLRDLEQSENRDRKSRRVVGLFWTLNNSEEATVLNFYTNHISLIS